MIRTGLFVCAVVLALIASRCAPPPGAPQSTVTGCDISQKIKQLSPGFSPSSYGNCTANAACAYGDPTQYVSGSPSSDQVAAIVAAYNVAPPVFQTSLCGLYAIYVDSDTDQSKPPAWGMRERRFPTGGNGYRTHIGVAARLLTALAGANPPYTTYEKAILSNLASSPFMSPPAPPPNQPPRSAAWLNATTFTATPDPAPVRPEAIALLGILAHEMGHIVWFDQVIAANAPPSSNDPILANDAFSAISWGSCGRQIATFGHKRGFHGFGEGNSDACAQRPPVDADFVRDLKNSDISSAATALNTIYNGEWASLFATIAPDEDFVETYKLMVLTGNSGGPLQSLKLQIPATSTTSGSTKDILANLTNPTTKLYQKAQWIITCLGWQPRSTPTCPLASWQRRDH